MSIAFSIFFAFLTQQPPMPHVRPLDEQCASLYQRGVFRSPTFRHLVAHIEESDVIVHLQCGKELRHTVAGVTTFVTRAGNYRILRVYIDRRLRGDEGVAVLGHELYHVTEMAAAPQVVDESGVRTLYMRLGYQACTTKPLCFDTVEAQRAGELVWRELAGARKR